eukprot:snap_masked-scaffold_2-processed-gene-26.15-mRNA-1 protein AED:1.00 eAED:1.00 QI:0/-1/0/0/-1/1/1/0/220
MKLKPESLKKQLPGNTFQYRELGFDNLIGVITKNLHLRSLQDEGDCEYEYVSNVECLDPYFDAMEEIFSTFSIEELDALIEFYENYDPFDFKAYGEGLAEIVGKGRFCTEDFVAALPILYTCVLPSCVNCEKNGEYYQKSSKEYTEISNTIYGCGLKFTLCTEEAGALVIEGNEEFKFYTSVTVVFISLLVVTILLISYQKRSLKTETFVETEIKHKQGL